MKRRDESRRGGQEWPRHGERGSALLIVFVFAAIFAIMLYREMPVAAFEAQRAKEELLIDRGNEYKHAVKLFVRKFGMFPPSIQALEDTNRIRFLRHKYTDPFTGKDDWRMLHAGPGGMIIDSKVKTSLNPLSGNSNGLGANGVSSNGASNATPTSNTTSTSSTNTANNTANTGFAGFSNSIAQPAAANGTDGTVVAPIPQRAPAVAANGNNAAIETGKPPGDSQQLPVPGAETAVPDTAANSNPNPTTNAGVNPSDPQAVLRTLLNTSPNPATPQQQGQPTSPHTPTGSGTISGGGIAGVASIAKGHSIKLVNDQDNFSLWEFYYDLTKEANAAMANAMQQPGGNAANPNNPNQNNANQNNANQNQSGFGGGNSFSTNSNSSTSNSNNTTTPSQSASPMITPAIPPPQ